MTEILDAIPGALEQAQSPPRMTRRAFVDTNVWVAMARRAELFVRELTDETVTWRGNNSLVPNLACPILQT